MKEESMSKKQLRAQSLTEKTFEMALLL
jgi:hypothetical protein